MDAELYNMIYELMLAFGISSMVGIILIIFGMRLWEMRMAELELKAKKRNRKGAERKC